MEDIEVLLVCLNLQDEEILQGPEIALNIVEHTHGKF